MKGKIAIFFGSLLLIAAYSLWHLMTEESVGITRAPQRVKEEIQELPQGEYQGKLIHFILPGGYVQVSHNVPESGPLKESLFFAKAGSTTSEKIALTVEERPEREFTASPSYQSRKNDGTYSEWFTEDKRGTLLEKESPSYEASYFVFWEGYLITITYTSPVPNTSAKAMLMDIEKSLTKVTSEAVQEES